MSDFRPDVPFDAFHESDSFMLRPSDCEWPTAWDIDFCADAPVSAESDQSAEDELLRLADDVPVPRVGLRDEFLLELTRVDRRRKRRRQLPVAVAFVAAALLGIFGPRPDSSDAGTAVARNESPRAAVRFLAHDYGPEELIAACREGDSWALVDAYSSQRDRHRARLRGGSAPSAD
jgi:hypothetical protein